MLYTFIRMDEYIYIYIAMFKSLISLWYTGYMSIKQLFYIKCKSKMIPCETNQTEITRYWSHIIIKLKYVKIIC